MQRPARARAAAVAALCALALLAACSDHGATSGRGPVRFDSEDGADEGVSQWVGIHARAGQQVVFGMLGVTNHGDRTAALDGAALTGPGDEIVDDGVRLAKVLVRDASHGEDYVGAGIWPFEHYPDDAVPIEGYELAPDATAELLYIVDVEDEGYWSWPRSEVTYTADGRSYRDATSTGFMVCPGDLAARCDAPE